MAISTSKSSDTSLLLALAPELRLKIYEAFFDILVATKPRYPWSPALPHSRFSAYLSLILINRQIKSEATAHFQRHYASKIIYYFESVPKLYTFIKAVPHGAYLPDARFNLRAGSHMLENDSRRTGRFILAQPWADPDWQRLNWFNHDGLIFGIQNPGVAPRHCSRHELELKGFTLDREPTEAKQSILLPQTVDKVDFPIPEPWKKSVRLTFWAPRPGWQPGPQRPARDAEVDLSMGCLELEARLKDADFSMWATA